jgi:hypothetical protein
VRARVKGVGPVSVRSQALFVHTGCEFGEVKCCGGL